MGTERREGTPGAVLYVENKYFWPIMAFINSLITDLKCSLMYKDLQETCEMVFFWV